MADEFICQWKEELSVGSEELDNQHRHMVEILNEIYQAYNRGEHKVVIVTIIEKLSQYMVYHFALEEEYFEMFDFYDKENHIKEHKMFRQKVEDFNMHYKLNDEALTCDIIIFLKDWLRDHILESDQKYKDCFLKHGIK